MLDLVSSLSWLVWLSRYRKINPKLVQVQRVMRNYQIIKFLVIVQVGPDWATSVNKAIDEDEAALKSIRQGEIDSCKASIANEESVQVIE